MYLLIFQRSGTLKNKKNELDTKLDTLVKTKYDIIKKFDTKEITKEEHDDFMKQVSDEIKEINIQKIKIAQNKISFPVSPNNTKPKHKLKTIKPIKPKKPIKAIKPKKPIKSKKPIKPKKSIKAISPNKSIKLNTPIKSIKPNKAIKPNKPIKFITIPNKKYYVKKNTITRKIVDLLKDSNINTELKVLNALKYYFPKNKEDELLLALRETIKSIKYRTDRKLRHLDFYQDKYLIKESEQMVLL